MCYPDCDCILTDVLLFRLSKRGFKTFRFLGLKADICFKYSNFLLLKGIQIGNASLQVRFYGTRYFVESVLIAANSIDSVSTALYGEII